MSRTSDPVAATLPAREAAERRSRVLRLLKKLPEATAVAHGTHMSLEVRGKRFAWFLEDHHGDGRLALHYKAAGGVAASLVRKAPERYHVPKHIGQHGWVGLWLDLPRTD